MSSRDRRRKLSNAEIQRIRKANSEKQKQKESFKWHWSLTIFLIGIILGIISFTWLASATVISFFEIVLIILIVAIISTPIQYKYFKKTNKIAATMKKAMPFYIAYNIVGIGFIGLFLFLTLNMTLASSEITQEHYEVIGADPEYKIMRGGSVVFVLEDEAYYTDVYLRAIAYK